MPSKAQLETALINADKAGDVAAATVLANALKSGQYDDAPQPETFDPTEGMSGFEKFAAGAGKAVVDTGMGLKQIGAGIGNRLGLVSDETVAGIQADIDERKRLDAPLMDTGAGMAGNITGHVAQFALPIGALGAAGKSAGLARAAAGGSKAAKAAQATLNASRLPGAVATGAGMGAVQPVATGESRGVNTAVGGAGGAVGLGAGKLILAGVGKIGRMASGKIASEAARKSMNASRDATLKSAQSAGYVVPPSEVRPTLASGLMERLAGKASVAQEASGRNQEVTNALARKALGLADDAPISEQTLEPIKQQAWAVYESVKKIGNVKADKAYLKALSGIDDQFNKLASEFPEMANTEIAGLVKGLRKSGMSSENAVELVKQLRFNAKSLLGHANTDPGKRALGKANAKAADAIEDLIERNVQTQNPGIVEEFRAARRLLGKVGSVERALNESTGDVAAKKLAAELAEEKKLAAELAKGRPMTDELRTIASFAQAFPRQAQTNVNRVPGGSPLDSIAAIGTSVGTGNPAWLSMMLARPAARRIALSKMMAPTPKYGPGRMVRALPPTARAFEKLPIEQGSVAIGATAGNRR